MKLMQRYRDLDGNGRGIVHNIVFAFLVKGGALVTSLLTAPAFLRYFEDRTVLGVWYTLLSALLWFLNFDLGLGNGLRNQLTRALSEGDQDAAEGILSSGIFAYAVLTLGLTVLGGMLLSAWDLNRLFGVGEAAVSRETLKASVYILFLGIMLRVFLSWVGTVFHALQMTPMNNFLALCVSILQLAFVSLVEPAAPEQGLLRLSAGYALLSNLPAGAAGLILIKTKLSNCRLSVKKIEKNWLRRILGIGTCYFVCQIAYMLILNTNELLISRFFGPQYTTEYTFYYKLAMLIPTVLAPALTPIWSAVARAMAEEDYRWVSRLYRKLKLAGLLASGVQFVFVPVQQFAMDLWLGPERFLVDYPTAVGFACFGSAFAWDMILSTMVSGMARLKLQMACYSAGAAVKFLLLPWIASGVDRWSGVVWCNAAVLAVYCLLQKCALDRYFRQYGVKGQQTEENERMEGQRWRTAT